MYQGLTSVLDRFTIPLSNCVALGVDNTNGIVGAHNSLRTRITSENPSIHVAGCVCHTLHNSAKKGGEILSVRMRRQREDRDSLFGFQYSILNIWLIVDMTYCAFSACRLKGGYVVPSARFLSFHFRSHLL